MNSEVQENPSERRPFILEGKPINFMQVLENGGSAHIETQPGSEKIIDVAVTPQSIQIRPQGKSPFVLRAEVSPISGELAMNLNLKDKEGNRNSDLPDGSTFVDEAMKFLDAHQKIERFTGTWKEDSDNFIQFLKATNLHRMSDQDAAFHTWTGKNVAKKFGFNYITNIYKDMRSDERYVIVKFSRTPPADQ